LWGLAAGAPAVGAAVLPAGAPGCDAGLGPVAGAGWQAASVKSTISPKAAGRIIRTPFAVTIVVLRTGV
jgi:hypothetical protein